MGYAFLGQNSETGDARLSFQLPQLSACKEVAMNYRPFAGLVASIFLLKAMLGSAAGAFAQSLPASGAVGAHQDFFLEAPGTSVSVVPPAKPATFNTTSPGLLQLPDARRLLAGATKIDGLVPLYQKDSQLYAALSAQDLDSDFILLISIARGIAQRPLVGGHTWQFGNDWVCQFRRVKNDIHLVRRNVRYRAEANSPAAEAVKLAYSDSILYSLPIVAAGRGDRVVVDLNPLFMSDLPGISQELPNFEFSADRSTSASVQGYVNNLELQVAATYTSDGKNRSIPYPIRGRSQSTSTTR